MHHKDDRIGNWGADVEVLDWRPESTPLTLAEDETHVWRAKIELASEGLGPLGELLTPDERARAERFRFDRDRQAFRTRRGILRALIGRYLGGGPFTERFALNAYGMPLLPAPHSSLHFNLSHSAGMVLFAFTRGRRVGVDIEAIRPSADTVQIAETFFSRAEREALAALPSHQQCAAFFACWARKEAYIKALGIGLSLPLDSFDVCLSPSQPAALLASRLDPSGVASWHMDALEAGPGYAAALVVETTHSATNLEMNRAA